MSFSAEKRNQIKHYLLEKLDDRSYAKKTSDAWGISLNSVYRYLRELEEDKIIEKKSKGYSLVCKTEEVLLDRSKQELPSEDRIYDKYIKKYMYSLPENVVAIWQYAFVEMMNNAIDHSESETVKLVIKQDYMNTTIMITDHGVGIFKKIKDYCRFETLDDAVNELFKGKLTTNPACHSGEGIFFTSRILDHFMAISDGKVFSHDKFTDEQLDEIESETVMGLGLGTSHGTVFYMQLSNFSKKTIKELFDQFADVDGGFIRTRIPIKNIFETYPVARSQAKRLCHRFEDFQRVELDFDGISEIGQGFAHEIFVVYQNAHPEVEITAINAAEDVQRMIYHVKHG
jgi:anti-sigma regulatory factor (Ser/Thr protein kinase)